MREVCCDLEGAGLQWNLFRWYVNDTEIQVTDTRNVHISMSGGRLDINKPTWRDVGRYHCEATNQAGTSISRTRNLHAAC